jgi:hypothetical protein
MDVFFFGFSEILEFANCGRYRNFGWARLIEHLGGRFHVSSCAVSL